MNRHGNFEPLTALYISCADPESFVRGGPTLTTFCLSLKRREKNPNTVIYIYINGPSSARQRNANKWRFAGGQIPRPNIECWLGSFVIFQGIRTSIAKDPYTLVIFRGGDGSGPPVPPLDPQMYLV